MRRCVVVAGAQINNYDFVKSYIKEDDFYIFCDGGLRHLDELQVTPDLIVGDFDSAKNPNLPVETIVLPCEKDDTDSYFAVKEAVKRGFDDFVIIGAVGGRMDHTIGNISILLFLQAQGKKAILVDDYSKMSIISKKPIQVDSSCIYFSLLNITGVAKGICVEKAKYPLTDGEILSQYQYGISNQVLPGKKAIVSVKEGELLLIEVFRE